MDKHGLTYSLSPQRVETNKEYKSTERAQISAKAAHCPDSQFGESHSDLYQDTRYFIVLLCIQLYTYKTKYTRT